MMTDRKPDIVQSAQDHGIELIQKGGKLWASCPFHAEKTPSFKIDSERQEFYCFGCHEHGDVITLIQKLKGLSFKETVRYLGIEAESPSQEMLKQQATNRHKRDLVQQFRKWETVTHTRVCNIYRAINKVLSSIKTEDDLDRHGDLYHRRTELELVLDILEGRDDELKYSLFKEATLGSI